MDKNRFLIKLSESAHTDFGRVDFDQQSEPQKVFSAIWALEGQVNNGGFLQYFESWDGDTAAFAPHALESIGARACASVVRQALALISQDPLPADREQRLAVLAKATDDDLAQLEKFDQAFMEYPDDLTDALFRFVESNPEAFGLTG